MTRRDEVGRGERDEHWAATLFPRKAAIGPEPVQALHEGRGRGGGAGREGCRGCDGGVPSDVTPGSGALWAGPPGRPEKAILEKEKLPPQVSSTGVAGWGRGGADETCAQGLRKGQA